jgi:hypothetical protein
MDTPTTALLVAGLSLVSTITFAILNYRYTKRTNERAIAAETRAAATEARSTERSRIAWQATLSDAGYVILDNQSKDPAMNVRVEYSIMLPADPNQDPFPTSYVRSHDPRGTGKYSAVFTQVAVKDAIYPHKVVGLPIPPNMPFSLAGGAKNGRRFGLNLHLEWFTAKGTPKDEHLFVEDIGVVFSMYDWPPVESLPWGESPDMEAVTPLKTPEDYQRSYDEETRKNGIGTP